MYQREEYLNWDEYFMSIAKLAADRSKDPSSQVGAVIVNNDNRIVATGYNGAPYGYDDENFKWAREGEELETKYPYVVHGEANAIAYCAKEGISTDNCKIYVTLFPCNECAKMIIQSGIKEVIYACDKYAETNSVMASKIMFGYCGIKYRQFDLEDDLVIESSKAVKRIRKREL